MVGGIIFLVLVAVFFVVFYVWMSKTGQDPEPPEDEPVTYEGEPLTWNGEPVTYKNTDRQD